MKFVDFDWDFMDNDTRVYEGRPFMKEKQTLQKLDLGTELRSCAFGVTDNLSG